MSTDSSINNPVNTLGTTISNTSNMPLTMNDAQRKPSAPPATKEQQAENNVRRKPSAPPATKEQQAENNVRRKPSAPPATKEQQAENNVRRKPSAPQAIAVPVPVPVPIPMPSAPQAVAVPVPLVVAAVAVGGPGLWNFFNALAFLILISFIFTSIFWGISKLTAVSEIKKNWKLYRCDPSIMPFASFYGYNAEENFNYCMGSIFNIHSSDITGSFSSILGTFTSVLSVLMNAVNSIRTSVATMGGGINVIFQDFTDRISTFFFQLRMSAIRIKMLIQRMYAIMFSILYMGTSAITGGVSFGNTVLFSFLDTFCFVPETRIHIKAKGIISISDVQIGDILLPTGSRVTAKFHFAANGQPMVQIGNIQVSSNHYIIHKTHWIRAEEHPDAITIGSHIGSSLICLNTHDHQIPIDSYIFRDYDETEENDVDTKTMRFIEQQINASICKNSTDSTYSTYSFKEYTPALEQSTQIRLQNGTLQSVANIKLGTQLSTGCKVIGKVHREIHEYCVFKNILISASTLVWNIHTQRWDRAGTFIPIHVLDHPAPVYIALFVTPSSIIELEDGTYIRDSIELCSPDAEMYYADQLKQLNT